MKSKRKTPRTPQNHASPAFRLYAKDFVTSETVASMELVEIGLYIKGLCFAWINRSLPNDDRTVYRILGCDEATGKKHWPVVKRNFYEKDGRLYNERLEHERVRQAERSRKCRQASLLAVDARRKKASTGRSPNGEPTDNLSVSVSDSLIDDDKSSSSVGKHKPKPFKIPTPSQVSEYMAERKWSNPDESSQKFCDYYAARGWKLGKTPMRSWKAAVRTWEKNEHATSQSKQKESLYDPARYENQTL